MTEPTTEAGRHLLERRAYMKTWTNQVWIDLILAIETEARASLANAIGELHAESPDDPQQTPTYWDGWHAATSAAVAIARQEARASQPLTLDVERLAQALAVGDGVAGEPAIDWSKSPAQIEWAQRVAAEYERLGKQ